MGKVDKTKSLNSSGSSYTEFYYHFFRNILVVTLPLLVISVLVLSLSHSSANSSGSDSLAITISSSCTLSSVVNIPHNTEVYNGNYLGDIGKTTIKTLCNDGNGYAIYANGYSNNEEGNNKLINSEHSEFSIDTGLNTSGSTSAWAMKLNNIPNDPSPTPPVIDPSYNNTYGLVPTYWTKVASRASGTTDMDEGSSFTTIYAIYTTSNQHAGTYNGQVKYVLTHPSYQPYVYYMQEVDQWKNLLALEESVQAIDMRDGKNYWVTKLKDGNIWMTQNLDFDINANTILNSKTTDLNVLYDASINSCREYQDGYTSNGNIIYWTPASIATTIDFEGTTVTGWANSNTEPYSANKTDSAETGHVSLGNYYNWTATIASNNSSTLTQDTLNNIANNPQNSICPKGWRLPTISSESETLVGSTNEFARLNYLYNGNATNTNTGWVSRPLFFVSAGAIEGGKYLTNGLRYLSSTLKNRDQNYFMQSTGDNNFLSVVSYNRGNGRSVWCVAR